MIISLSSPLRLVTAIAVLGAAVAMMSPSAFAVVVISDGFGDADLNNNGTPFEDVDTNVQGSLSDTTYVPGRLRTNLPGDFDGNQTVDLRDYTVWRDNLGDPSDEVIADSGDGIDGVTNADYLLWQGNLGAASPNNNEISEPALNPSDTGIRWLQMRGFTGAANTMLPGSDDSKPLLRIVDDSQGAMLETKASSEPGGLDVKAIDSGYAMAWESKGGGSSAAGFFDQQIALGPQDGDEVKVSFDFRIWRDAPNQNGNNTDNVPAGLGEVRFGLFQDTDNQLVAPNNVNPFAGRQPVDGEGNTIDDQFTPAIWGQEEGMFEGSLTGTQGAGDDVGTNGDHGWTASAPLGDITAPPVLLNGSTARIREEIQSDRILQGQDTHTIAQPQDTTPDDPFNPTFDFINMSTDGVYNIALSLVRATDTNPGDTITASLIITDITDPQNPVEFVLSGTESLDDGNTPGSGGIQSDAWDYFAIRNDGSGAAEFDFILDNFLLEVNGSNAPSLVVGANVPEPASVFLFGLAGVSLLAVSRFRS